MRTSNPAFRESVLQDAMSFETSDRMTMQGTAIKTGISLCLLFIAAAFTWTKVEQGLAAGDPSGAVPWMFGGLIVGLLVAIATCFKPNWAPVTTPVYALAEGLFLGALSAFINAQFAPDTNIAFQAACLTFGTLFTMLVGYQSGWIKCTEKFRMGVVAATGAIFLVYLISFVMSMFGLGGMPVIHGNSMFGIGFSVVVVVIAALNLVLDFDTIERLSNQGAPKSMEWYGAFALLTTLVWLYIEILRLLSKLQSRD